MGGTWSNPENRHLIVDGITGYGSVIPLIITALLASMVSYWYVAPVWFFTQCLFGSAAQVEGCSPWPPLNSGPLSVVAASAIVVGFGYVALYRASVRHGWHIALLGVSLNAAHGFSMVLGSTLIALLFSNWAGPDRSQLEWLVILSGGPILTRILWGLRYIVLLSWWRLFPHDVVGASMRLHLSHTFKLDRSEDFDVSWSRGCLKVRGPFDVVDVKRIDDLTHRFLGSLVSQVDVDSTLDEETFYLPYTSVLGPSGYVSPPIPPTRTISLAWILGIFVAVMVTWVAIIWLLGWEWLDHRSFESLIQTFVDATS